MPLTRVEVTSFKLALRELSPADFYRLFPGEPACDPSLYLHEKLFALDLTALSSYVDFALANYRESAAGNSTRSSGDTLFAPPAQAKRLFDSRIKNGATTASNLQELLSQYLEIY
jgi:hypothetical protein